MSAKFPNNQDLVFIDGTAVSFSMDGFDDFIASQGVQLTHYTALRCPVGRVDVNDDRAPHPDHSGCTNGMIYTKAGVVTSLFLSAGKNVRNDDMGEWNGSTVKITMPRFYEEDGKDVRITTYDRLYLTEDILRIDKLEYGKTDLTGRNKLAFPIVEIFDLMDSTGKDYQPGEYSVDKGVLVWNSPVFNPTLNEGLVFSVRYTYRPFYYVGRILHETRVAQTEDLMERSVKRMPIELIAHRENFFEKSLNDELQVINPDEPYQELRKRSGPDFGSR